MKDPDVWPKEMALIVEPLVLEDFEVLLRHPPGDDLVATPMAPLCWPLLTAEDGPQRLRYYITRQIERFKTDPTARYMKVTDQRTGEIISTGRWHCYSQGYDLAREGWKDIDALGPPGNPSEIPHGLNWKLYKGIFKTTKWRAKGVSKDSPCWSECFCS